MSEGKQKQCRRRRGAHFYTREICLAVGPVKSDLVVRSKGGSWFIRKCMNWTGKVFCSTKDAGLGPKNTLQWWIRHRAVYVSFRSVTEGQPVFPCSPANLTYRSCIVCLLCLCRRDQWDEASIWLGFRMCACLSYKKYVRTIAVSPSIKGA